MKRSVIAALTTVAVVIGLGVALSSTNRSPGRSDQPPDAAKADSVWYHASDVALLARTGRPQLVEFFHPS